MTLDAAKEAIYKSLDNDNEDIDLHIANLKAAMKEAGAKDVTFKANRLAQNNRQGRKVMQAYFKKRVVIVKFESETS